MDAEARTAPSREYTRGDAGNGRLEPAFGRPARVRRFARRRVELVTGTPELLGIREGEQSRVIVLPQSHSPLALLKRLEHDYPQADSLPDALLECGQYYQSRRQFAQALDEYRREIKLYEARHAASANS